MQSGAVARTRTLLKADTPLASTAPVLVRSGDQPAWKASQRARACMYLCWGGSDPPPRMYVSLLGGVDPPPRMYVRCAVRNTPRGGDFYPTSSAVGPVAPEGSREVVGRL